MTRGSQVRHERLSQLEAEFEPLLLSCLQQAGNGRYGLFGQNDHLAPQHRNWNWPEARLLVEMAEETQACLGGRSPEPERREANFGGRACVRWAGVL